MNTGNIQGMLFYIGTALINSSRLLYLGVR